MKLLAVNLKDYLLLSSTERQDYEHAFKYAKECEPKDTASFGMLQKKTFGEVKDIQDLFSSAASFELFISYFEKLILSLNIFEVVAFYRYIQSQVEFINEIEIKAIISEKLGSDSQDASNRFSKYGVFMQIDALANGDVTKYDLVRNIQYETGLLKLSLSKDTSEFQNERLNKIKQDAKI